MDVIILNAGVGKRLYPLTLKKHKSLIEINKFTILDYQLTMLNKKKLKTIIVTGYLSNQIEGKIKSYKDVQIVKNEHYDTTDNAYSLLLGFSKVKNERVIILDGDVLFEEALLDKVLDPKLENAFLVDFSQKIMPEDAKVKVKDGFAIEYGKQVEGEGIFISICLLGGSFLKKFVKELKKNKYPHTWYSKPLSELMKKKPRKVKVISSDGLKWIEIDDFKDLERAKELFKDEKI